VEVALAVAGIPARRRKGRQPSGRRADVTDEMLRELYSRPEVTVRVLVERSVSARTTCAADCTRWA